MIVGTNDSTLKLPVTHKVLITNKMNILICTDIIFFMLNNIMHLDLCRLMVYMPNYALRPNETKSVQCIIYIAGYNFYDLLFYGPVLSGGIAMGQ